MFENKIVLVTGGTRGIGYSIVENFLKESAIVVLFGSKEESVSKALNSLRQLNSSYKVEGYATDLADFKSCRRCCK